MTLQEMKRPPLPRSWYRPTGLGFLAFLLFSVAWLPLFGWLSYTLAVSELPLWSRVLLLIPTTTLAGHSFHMFGWFAHEGVHLSLLPNKYASAVTGIIVGGAALFPSVGYAVTHWKHHRFTNQASDPDTKIYPQHRTFAARFLRGRVTANRGYFRNTLACALGRPQVGYKVPFSDGWMRRLAIFSLLCITAWLAIYLAIAAIHPTYFLFGVLLPFLTAIPATGLRIYLEHNGTGAGVFHDTRSYTSPIWTFLMFGNNFHLEHHLYPTVPSYHLPRVHRLLNTHGLLAHHGAHVTTGFFAPLKFLGGAYQYPDSLIDDLVADPFVPDIAGDRKIPD